MSDAPFQFANYLTVFVDLLGHRNLYQKIADIPEDGSTELPEFAASQLEKHHNAGNSKLAIRYLLLSSYLNENGPVPSSKK